MNPEGGTYFIKNVKVEIGNKATDWTPAPEDIDESIDYVAEQTNESLNATNNRVIAAETTVQILQDCISMLVRNENGESLMTQTEDGWHFSMSDTNKAVSDLSASLNELNGQNESTQATIKQLQDTINDHGVPLEYVNIISYEGEPCIELGESDSDFKLLITNTRIMFMNSDNVPTYINTNGLVTQNIEVEHELRQGNWVWVTHGKGNLGLMWKEVTS